MLEIDKINIDLLITIINIKNFFIKRHINQLMNIKSFLIICLHKLNTGYAT